MDTSSIQNNLAATLGAIAQPAAPNPIPEERRALIKAVDAINAARLFGGESELSFMIDRSTRRPVVRIVDRQTREVIQQIPAEYVLRMAEELKRA
jgi:flagellar protein FlaG